MEVSCMANVATTIMILVEIMVKTSPIVVVCECLDGALVLFGLATSNYVVLRLRFFSWWVITKELLQLKNFYTERFDPFKTDKILESFFLSWIDQPWRLQPSTKPI